jgi:hypothetical protein
MTIASRIAVTQPANLLQFLKMEETAGGTASDSSGNSYDGTYNGVTLNTTTNLDGQPAGTWDGINDKVDAHSAGVAAAFDGQEGTVLIAIQTSAWTDSTNDDAFLIQVDSNNRIFIRKTATNNRLTFNYKAGGTTKTRIKDGVSDTGSIIVAMTWSLSAGATGEFKAYWDGTQEGATIESLGTWAGTPGTMTIGAFSTASYWNGSLSFWALWDTPLTSDEIEFIVSGAEFTTIDAEIDVYIDWDQDGFTDADKVTSDVDNGSATIGILDSESRVSEIGQLTLTLDNSTREYTPDNTGGSHYGDLVPKTPVKVTGVGDSGAVDLWTGFIVDIQPFSNRYGDRLCTITCQDRLRDYQNNEDIRLPLQQDISADELLLLIDAATYESDTATGTLTFDDIPNNGDVVTIGNKSYDLLDTLTPADGEVGIFTDQYNNQPTASNGYFIDDTPQNLAAAINHDDDGTNTYYAATTPRHTQVVATLDHVSFGWPVRSEDSEMTLNYTGGGPAATYTTLACVALLQGESIDNVASVQLRLAKTGTPAGTLTLGVYSQGGDGFPTTELVDANAVATFSEASLTTSLAYVDFTFTAPIQFNADDMLVLTSSSGVSLFDYVRWGADSTQGSLRGVASRFVLSPSGWESAAANLIFWSPAILTIEANARGTWANTLALSTASKHYSADTLTLNTGVGSGALSDTFTQNMVYYQVQEVTGTPGFDLVLSSTISGTAQNAVIYGRYEGSGGHTVQVRAFNWDTSAYVSQGTLTSSTNDAKHSFALTSVYTSSGGVVRIQIYHTSPGNATHDLYVDHFYIESDTAAGSAENITVSGSTLSGGTQPTEFTPDYETGVQEFEYAADTWTQAVNAMTALQETTESEVGFFAIGRDGNPIFKNTDYWFAAHTQTRRTIDNTQLSFNARHSMDDIRNSYTIDYRERALLEGVQIGKGPRVIKLQASGLDAGGYDGGRWNTWSNREQTGWSKTITISTVNEDTGEKSGVVTVDPPVLGTHYTLNTRLRTELGQNLTNPNLVRFSWGLKGAGVELTVTNVSTRLLWMHDLYLDGDVLDYSSPVQFLAEDTTSIDTYGISPGDYTIWLPTGEPFATSLGEYLLVLNKDPRTMAETLETNLLEFAADVHLFDIDLFDVIDIDEYQWSFDNPCMVTGIEFSFDARSLTNMIFYLRQLDPFDYGIWDDATWGKWDTAVWAL